MERGADAYLAKPFEQKELLIRLEKLLELREKLQAYYSNPKNLSAPSSQTPHPKENTFILKVRTAVEANIDNENFEINDLCQLLFISRSHLHLKIKAVTGRSTSSFIRFIRLTKAKELLTQTDLNVSEIAYEVGFKNAAYFTQSFSKEFGVSPSNARG